MAVLTAGSMDSFSPEAAWPTSFTHSSPGAPMAGTGRNADTTRAPAARKRNRGRLIIGLPPLCGREWSGDRSVTARHQPGITVPSAVMPWTRLVPA